MIITKREIEFIEVSYWACNNEQHRHTKESVAQHCIDNSNKPKKIQKRWSRRALVTMKNQYEEGRTQAQLARDYKMSSANMARLLKQAKWMIDREIRTGKVSSRAQYDE